MTTNTNQYNARIEELEKKDLNNIDVIIQHNLPSEFVYSSKAKNIGCFAYETSGFPNSTWKQNLEIMDGIVVPCNFMTDLSYNSNTFVIPHAIDTEKFNKPTENYAFGTNKNTVKFYTISEYNKRKNISGLVLAYLSTFDANDNVVLVIKTVGSAQTIKTNINDIKFGLKRFDNIQRYAKIILITDQVDDTTIDSIHSSCNVFVSASYGEGFCIPAVEAMGWGNMLLVPHSTAFADLHGHGNLLVETNPTKCFGSVDSLRECYTSDEIWSSPSILDMSALMREIYEYRLFEHEIKNRKEFVKSHYSRETIGKQYKNILENLLNAK